MNRFQPPTIRQRGQVAQAMAAVYAHKPQAGETKGQITCPACRGGLSFNIQANGLSRGRCGCGLSWLQ